jgi:exonuclease SbcC
MIETIHIKNFQSHKDTYITFGTGVNVITGTSDSGKTSLLRGLIWLTTNKPGGEAFRSDWGGETSVTIELADGNTIARIKGKQNKYLLNDQEFFAFKTGVPEEIQKVLNFNNLNIQEQLEKPFLLDETPGKVAAHFNKVANLEKIDISTAKIKSAALKVSQSLSSKKEQKKGFKETLLSFDYLEKREIDLEVLEEKEKQYLVSVKQFSKLSSLIEKVEKVNKKLKEKSRVTCFEDDLEKLSKKNQDLEDSKLQYNMLFTFIESLRIKENELKELKKLTGLEKRVKEITVLIESQAVSIGNHEGLGSILVNISENKESLLNSRKTTNKLELKFKENFPDICPMCETVIN